MAVEAECDYCGRKRPLKYLTIRFGWMVCKSSCREVQDAIRKEMAK